MQTLWCDLNLTLETTAGYIDLWGEVAGGTYETLQERIVEVDRKGVTPFTW